MSGPLALTGEVLLLCERAEQARFLQVYLRFLFQQTCCLLPTLQLLSFQNLAHLGPVLQRLPLLAGSEQVRRLLIFADAGQALEQRQQHLLELQSQVPLRKLESSAAYFFPGRQPGRRWRRGYLEDNLWAALRRETSEYNDYYNLSNMSADYLQTVNNGRGREQQLTNYHKHLLYVYLAGTEKYAGLRLEEAAQAGAFDLQHSSFDSLRECLLSLRS